MPPRKSHIIFVTGTVSDTPNRNANQRVKALSTFCATDVITTSPLPDALRRSVKEVHVVKRWLLAWLETFRLARRLKREKSVVIHTTYAPRPMIAGFLCRVFLGCQWVYDLYDHPSMTWDFSHGAGRLFKRTLWRLVLSRMLPLADVWIIGMHPGILSHLPTPRRRCRLVLTEGPGTSLAHGTIATRDEISASEVVICYAGPVKMVRGMGLIAEWCRTYEGPPACLHIMGREEAKAAAAIESVREEAQMRGLRIVQHGWTAHEEVLEIMRNGDIGICTVDPDILNYRYAYPVKVVEYMSLGLIAVATDGQGVRALIRHRENGFVCNYESRSFRQTMKSAIQAVQDPKEKERILRNARTTMEGRDWDSVNHRLLADIETALSVAQ